MSAYRKNEWVVTVDEFSDVEVRVDEDGDVVVSQSENRIYIHIQDVESLIEALQGVMVEAVA